MIIFSIFRRFSLEKQVCLSRLRPLKFFKRKKRKKESRPFKWKVSEKKFFKKNTTRYISGSVGVKSEMDIVANRYGWRFFLKPVGLELFFLNTWNLPLLSFFLFFVLNIQSECSCLNGFHLKEWELIWKMVVFGKGIKFFGWMKKPNQKIKMLFIWPENFILFRLQEFIIFYWSNVLVFFLGLVLGDLFLDLIFEEA